MSTGIVLEASAGSTPAQPRWGAVYAMTLCTFVLIVSEFMPMSLLSPIAQDLQLTEGQAGQAISISGLTAMLTSLTIARMIGGMDRRFVLLGLTLLLVLSGTLVAWAPNFAVLMTARAVLGFAIGGFWSMSAAIMMRLVPADAVPKALAVLNGGNALATVVGAPLGSFLGGLISWRGAFLCVVPLALAATLWQLFSLPRLPADTRRNTGGLLILLRHKPVSIGLCAITLQFVGQFGLYTYLRPFLEHVTGVNLGALSTLLLAIGVAGFVGTLLINRLIGRRLHLLLAACPLILAAVAVGLALFGTSLPIVAVLLAIWGLVSTSAPVAWWVWITRVAPDHVEAGGGLLVASAQFAIMAGATLGGLAFDAVGARPEFLGCAVVLVLAAVMALGAKAEVTSDAQLPLAIA